MLGFYEDEYRYYQYFDQILGDGQFTLDITPSYSGLSEETLADIHDIGRMEDFSKAEDLVEKIIATG